jgi:amino acid adenylation domain-containing protein
MLFKKHTIIMLDSTNFLRDIADVLGIPPKNLNLNASLLDNGGDSLALVQLQNALRREGVCLSPDFVFSTVTIAELLHLTTERVLSNPPPPRQETKRKQSFDVDISTKRTRESHGDEGNCAAAQQLVQSARSCPMTEMQLALLQGSLKHPAVNVIHYHEIHHPRNVPLLKAAWQAVTDNEPILRCTYKLYGSEVYLVEQDNSMFDWDEVIVFDNHAFEESISEQKVEEGFFGSSFRVVTLRGRDERVGKSRITWRVHHSLVDGYSHNLLLSKVRNFLLGEKPSVGPPFAGFVAGLHALQASSKFVGEEFWKAQLAQCPHSVSRLAIAAPLTKPTQRMDLHPVIEMQVDSDSFSKRCKHLGFTLPTLYHAAWALTLSKYTNSKDISFGTVLCGRSLPIPDIKSLIGPTINTVPVYVRLEETSTFLDLMRQTFETLIGLAVHQWTVPKHGFSRDFDTALNIQIDLGSADQPDFEMLETPSSSVRSEIPLQVEVLQGGRLRMHYNPAVLLREQVKRISQTFETALSMAWNATSSLDCCASSLLKIERDELSKLGNWEEPSTRCESVKDDLVSLFLHAARLRPSAIALQKGTKTLTYNEVDIQSTQVAHQLSHVTSPGSVVCVQADRSFYWIVAVYAVLKAGCVYCPFSEDLPTEVRNQNFSTSGARVFLASSESTKTKSPKDCNMSFSVEGLLRGNVEDTLYDEQHWRPHPDANAYLCFTSGSTGKPKGVMCRHRGLVAFQSDFTVRLCARPSWRVAQVMSPAFDGSIHEIFSTLSYGATLLLKDPTSPLGHLRQADVVILTPSVARALDAADYLDLKMVYFVGEAVTPAVRDAWAAKTLFNMYGPTEATCGATIKQLLPNQPITLGKPNCSTRLYILDKQQHLSPRGVIGEICLAGVQISSGYLNRPDETAKRFLLDTINPQTKEYMYRTGDKGYWNSNGELVFLGRTDRQIKLHGFRIDLDDLEVRMLQASTEARAVAITLSEDLNELVALVQPSNLDLERFRVEIAAQVPSYALPRRVSAVGTFPMTTAGKLNYKKIGREAKGETENVEPPALSSPLVAMIITAARKTLGSTVSPVLGPDSDFFDSDLTSISLVLLSQHLSKLLARKISIRVLLQSRTVRRLAECIEKLDDIEQKDDGVLLGESRVAPIEADWWAKYQVHSDTSSFNVNFVCALGTSIKREKLARAWNAVLARHRILRCKYEWSKNTGIHRLYDEKPPTAKIVNSFYVDSEINTPFDLRQGQLIRVVLSPSYMSVVASHIICDLTTLNVLLKEVADAYQGRELLMVQRTYSQTSWSTVPSATQLAFWSTYLKDARTPAFFHSAPKRQTWAGTSRVVTICDRLYARIRMHAAAQKITMHQMALAAVAVALQDDGAVDVDITIGAPYINRNSEEDQSVVGLFLEPLPIRIQYSSSDEEQAQSTFLHVVQASSRSALSHAVSFHHLTSSLGIVPDYPKHPLFDAVVTFHEISQRPSFPVAGTRAMGLWSQGAKFELLVEFSVTEAGKLVLRLEYSTECFMASDITLLERRIERTLESLSAGDQFAQTLHILRQ